MNVFLKSTGLIMLAILSRFSFSQENEEADSRIASVSLQYGIYASPIDQVDLTYLNSEYADMLTYAVQGNIPYPMTYWDPSFSVSAIADIKPKGDNKNKGWNIGLTFAQHGHRFYLIDEEIIRVDTLSTPNSTRVAYIDSVFNHTSKLNYKNTDLKFLFGGTLNTNRERRFYSYIGCQFGLGVSISNLTFGNKFDEYEDITYDEGYYYNFRNWLLPYDESTRTDYGFNASVTGVIGGNLRIGADGLLAHTNLFFEYRPRISYSGYKNRKDILYAATSDVNIGMKVTL